MTTPFRMEIPAEAQAAWKGREHSTLLVMMLSEGGRQPFPAKRLSRRSITAHGDYFYVDAAEIQTRRRLQLTWCARDGSARYNLILLYPGQQAYQFERLPGVPELMSAAG